MTVDDAVRRPRNPHQFTLQGPITAAAAAQSQGECLDVQPGALFGAFLTLELRRPLSTVSSNAQLEKAPSPCAHDTANTLLRDRAPFESSNRRIGGVAAVGVKGSRSAWWAEWGNAGPAAQPAGPGPARDRLNRAARTIWNPAQTSTRRCLWKFCWTVYRPGRECCVECGRWTSLSLCVLTTLHIPELDPYGSRASCSQRNRSCTAADPWTSPPPTDGTSAIWRPSSSQP